jgi:ABC-2 type transport system permease protein
MFSLYKKELNAFFSSLVGYVVLLVFLVAAGVFLWILPDTNILDYGYATLDQFFSIAPWLLLFLIPAVTMRSFADEFKAGTIEWLSTKPLRHFDIIFAKYLASLTLVLIAILPTLIYLLSINWLAVDSGALDFGGIAGSYAGLIFLAAAFTAIGVFCSALTDNQIVSFLAAVLLCLLLYSGFEALSRIPSFRGGADYYLGLLGMDSHYISISRGVIDSRDVIYFLSLAALFVTLTHFTLQRKRL